MKLLLLIFISTALSKVAFGQLPPKLTSSQLSELYRREPYIYVRSDFISQVFNLLTREDEMGVLRSTYGSKGIGQLKALIRQEGSRLTPSLIVIGLNPPRLGHDSGRATDITLIWDSWETDSIVQAASFVHYLSVGLRAVSEIRLNYSEGRSTWSQALAAYQGIQTVGIVPREESMSLLKDLFDDDLHLGQRLQELERIDPALYKSSRELFAKYSSEISHGLFGPLLSSLSRPTHQTFGSLSPKGTGSDPVVTREYKDETVLLSRRSGATDELPFSQLAIAFKTNTDEILDTKSRENISTLARVMRYLYSRSPRVEFAIEAHASLDGGEERNLELTRLRARKVRSLLLAAGVPASALPKAEGFGSVYAKRERSAPLVERQLDRRVLAIRLR